MYDAGKLPVHSYVYRPGNLSQPGSTMPLPQPANCPSTPRQVPQTPILQQTGSPQNQPPTLRQLNCCTRTRDRWPILSLQAHLDISKDAPPTKKKRMKTNRHCRQDICAQPSFLFSPVQVSSPQLTLISNRCSLLRYSIFPSEFLNTWTRDHLSPLPDYLNTWCRKIQPTKIICYLHRCPKPAH